jgi:signal transduction histidine kinase
LLRVAVAEARRLISLLAEPQAEEQGLVASLQTLVERFRADRGLDVELVSSFGEPMLSPAARLTVLRMVSEALNNVGRHSRSKRAEVSVSASDDRLTVAVRDWGVGFDPALVGSGHFGLAGMAQRVGLLGGHTTVDSAPGQGTTVLITLPLHGDTPQG